MTRYHFSIGWPLVIFSWLLLYCVFATMIGNTTSADIDRGFARVGQDFKNNYGNVSFDWKCFGPPRRECQ